MQLQIGLVTFLLLWGNNLRKVFSVFGREAFHSLQHVDWGCTKSTQTCAQSLILDWFQHAGVGLAG